MATLIENTNKVVTSFDEIRKAIIAKGVDVPSGTSVEEYASLIASIVVGYDSEAVTAEAGDVLAGKIFVDKTGTASEGIMPDNGKVEASISAGESFSIAEGYHSGEGSVTAKSIAEQTEGTAEAADILSGRTAFVNGKQIEGSMTNHGAVELASEYVVSMAGINMEAPNMMVAGGYYEGITLKGINVKLAEHTVGTATAPQIVSGETAWVNGRRIKGSMISKEAETFIPGIDAQSISAGQYLAGEQIIAGDANLISENIKSGVSIFGVEGSFTSGDISVVDMIQEYVPRPASFSYTLDIPKAGIYYLICGTAYWGGSSPNVGFRAYPKTEISGDGITIETIIKGVSDNYTVLTTPSKLMSLYRIEATNKTTITVTHSGATKNTSSRTFKCDYLIG